MCFNLRGKNAHRGAHIMYRTYLKPSGTFDELAQFEWPALYEDHDNLADAMDDNALIIVNLSNPSECWMGMAAIDTLR